MIQRILSLTERKDIRYIITGGLTFIVNMLAVWVFIGPAGLNETDFQRNLSHFLGAEVSFLFGFNLNNYWTWRNRNENYVSKLFKYHLVNFITLGFRQIGFYVMDQYGFNWIWATVVPLALSIIINFLGYDKLIFKNIDTSENS